MKDKDLVYTALRKVLMMALEMAGDAGAAIKHVVHKVREVFLVVHSFNI